ncbi:MAG: YggU family protein [Methylophilales bacterium RIFCSPHIGHO2_02_FULL_57_10]|nr:MAG: YggU family protein [Methylophilales bacterium RIFCSPHIGHO2_02_FULL_57_10]
MNESWYTFKENGRLLTLSLYIQPNASKTAVAGLHGEALKIKVAASPIDHQANDKLLEFLRESFKVAKNQVVLKHGVHSRRKVVEILDPSCSPETLFA